MSSREEFIIRGNSGIYYLIIGRTTVFNGVLVTIGFYCISARSFCVPAFTKRMLCMHYKN